MATLTAAERKRLPKKDFAGPDDTYPDENAAHARLAIAMASRAEHIGNISKAEEDRIRAKARKHLRPNEG